MRGLERPGFRKEGAAARADAFAAEVEGLDALRPHIRVPQVLDVGVKDGRAFILLEHLKLQRDGDYAALGRMLAKLHRQTAPRFGWGRDNYIGLAPQQNGWCDEWPEFWLEKRMRPQLDWARRRGFILEMPDLTLLHGHRPQPSLLHGDLWNGNAGFTAEGPVVFDPAVYYGDREADLAMTELFGGFPREFYRAYDEAFPRDEGYARRKPLYNLYHLLNHLNLFGGGYLGQVKATLRLLLLG
ncbi:MAG TPA: fructosamine kinase family protein [Burkholderiales bacterium]